MIRHSSSFLISLVLHALLLVVLFYAYKEYKTTTLIVKNNEHKLYVNLSCLSEQSNPTPIIKQQKKTKVKKSKKQIKKIIAKKSDVIIKKKLTPLKPLLKPVATVIQKTVKVEQKVEKVVPTFQKVAVNKNVKDEVKKSIKKEVKKEVKKISSPEEEYMNENLVEIVALLQENLYYPRRARKRGVEGEVVIRFTLSKNAEVSDIEVLSSKSEILSRGAIKTIENIEHKFPKPKQKLTFNVPISYSLH